LQLEFGARTDLGRVRGNNEDSYGAEPELKLFVVSDGMGGAEHGEVASSMAVEGIVKHCRDARARADLPLEGESRPDLSPTTNRLVSAIRAAHRRVYERSVNEPALRGMGATVVAAMADGEKLSVAHVGDSRVYRLRGETFEQLTRDHSLVAEQVRLGLLTDEQAADSSLQTILTRALGHSENVEVDADEHTIEEGDTFLLCSDGLSRMVPDAAIASAIRQAANPQEAADRLIDLANEAGGEDNITAVVLRARAGTASSGGWFRRMWH
jgi:serine/threonine protein phosphatase PrpC